MRLDERDGKIHVSYPFKPSAWQQKSNYRQAVVVQSNIEKRLVRDGLVEAYDKEMNKAISAGSVIELTEQDMEEWTGPVHYLTHFPVIKPSSVTTKVRIVANSKMKNQHTGLSLNDVVEPGPNSLNPLLDVLILFRGVEVGLLFDLCKAYQQLVTGDLERHLRRFVYRASSDQPWRTYCYDRVTFGDVVAALCLELAKKKAADLGESLDALAASRIKLATYVDDHLGGGLLAEVLRMRGEPLPKGGFSGTMYQILERCGFDTNHMIMTKSCSDEEIAALGGTVLGIPFKPREDQFAMKIVLTVVTEGKKRKKKIAYLTEQDIKAMRCGTMKLTKRMVLSMVMTQYDPLGLQVPLMVKAKILLRRLYGPGEVPWDEQLPDKEKAAWTQFMNEVLNMKPILFTRSTRPSGAEGRPWLIGFCDGSLSAFCVTIYVLWKICGSGREATLLMAKSRVAPVYGTTVPRMELQSLTVLSRMMNTAARALPDQVERALLIGDSECTIAALEKTSGDLGPYFSNRVAEIHDNLERLKEAVNEVEPVWHVSGLLNPADLGTRGHVSVEEIGPGSFWQQGPRFLRETDRDKWPLKRHFTKNSIPTSETRTKHEVSCIREKVVASDNFVRKIQDLMVSCYSWSKSGAVLARLTRAMFQGRQAILQEPGPRDLQAARHLLFLVSMPDTLAALKRNKLSTLCVKMQNGLMVTTGRFTEKTLAKLLGKENLPVLMSSTILAKLILRECHEEDHRKSPGDVLARSRNHAWIHRGMALAKKVVKECMTCRLKETKTAQQVMASVPEDILAVSPPFTVTACDLFGPYLTRGMGGGVRRSMKVWGVLFICLRTKATSIMACPGYDTQSFETTYTKFISVYGEPALLISDQGTQLVGAAKNMDQTGINWDKITAGTAKAGTKWMFTPRGCAWRNGMAERAIGMAKQTLSHQLDGYRSLNFHELDALFHQVAKILNSRPIGVRYFTDDNFHAITPNDLLLGRSAGPRKEQEAVLPTDIIEVKDPRQALSAHEELCDRWWAEWSQVAFPLLVPRRRWAKEHRNLCIGDIVLLKYDSKVSKGRYRLARVTQVHPDSVGRVRTVTVGMRPRQAKEKPLPYKPKITEFEVGVQRLVVILPIEEQDQVQTTLDQGDKEEETIVSHDEETVEHEDENQAAGQVDAADRAKRQEDEDLMMRPLRRSRRKQGLAPAAYFVAVAQGRAPQPELNIGLQVPTALITLQPGGVPHQVPEWVPAALCEEGAD